MNYGNHLLGGIIDINQVNDDLDELWSNGIRNLRIALSNYTYIPGVDATKQAALLAKGKGFYVMWGVSHKQPLSDSNWQDYANAVLSASQWAKDNELNEFQVGNELDATWNAQITVTDIIGKIHALADQITGITTSFSIAQDSRESEWITRGKGNLSHLCYNVYGSNFDDFKNKITNLKNAFPDIVITEWNLFHAWSGFPPANEQKAKIQERYNFLETQGLTHYFFTYRGDPNESSGEAFALKRPNGELRDWSEVLYHPITPDPDPTPSGTKTIHISAEITITVQNS